jgi:glycosyltransferase involved in cell wall biosynthesis
MQKLLIISYYWPPSGGAGVQRWLKLSKYLNELGTEIHILTVNPDYASYMQTDESLEHDISPNITVHTTKSFEPINIYARLVGKNKVPTAGFANVDTENFWVRVVNFVRSNLFIPDPRRGWIPFAVRTALEIIDEYQITKVITTSPPHSTQLIGLKLRRKRAIEWIADFRDPWTDIYYYKILMHSFLSSRIDAGYELKVLTESDRIITANNSLKHLFISKSAKINPAKFFVLTNGFDPADFKDLRKAKSSKFRIVYTGTMADQYHPDNFILALADFIHSNEVKDIIFTIVGKVSQRILEKIQAMKLLPYFEHIQTVPHSEINAYQKNAEVLLLMIPQVDHSDSIIPGKIFEYLATGNVVLNIGPVHGDAGKILEECDMGATFDWNDFDSIKFFIIQKYLSYKEGNLKATVPETVKRYNRKVQAENLLSELFK